jgi:arsenite-transporting ATPase
MNAHSFTALIANATRFLFFTGKGGVGKTSMACAVAVGLADQGKRVLLVSTDPASNLDEVLNQPLGGTPTPISSAPGLFALNIDPQEAARAYRERLVGPLKGKLPEAVTRRMEEELSGACTVEIAAFDEFSTLLADDAATSDFEHVIFDTAPTGHTLRLLSLPTAWTSFLNTNTSSASCLGPLAGLQKKRELYEGAVGALSDPNQTIVVLVTRAQTASLAEASRTSLEFEALGVKNQKFILNGRFRSEQPTDEVAASLMRREAQALQTAGQFLSGREVIETPLLSRGVLGVAALRSILNPQPDAEVQPAPLDVTPNTGGTESLEEFVEAILLKGRGVVMAMGKGGVGKTTVAAAIALQLAERGAKVHFSTTDPAAHVAAVTQDLPELEVSRIDPAAVTKDYVEHVLNTAGKNLDPQGRALLEEDLRSPCTEEIAVFRAFANIVAKAEDKFVVLDTAPTGHTLLLLDATEAYHREVARKGNEVTVEVRSLLPRLRDPDFTTVFLVTLPEATPVHEAATLQEDLKRAGIGVQGWIINQSFAASGTIDPILLRKAAHERRYIQEVKEEFATMTAIIPWLPAEPVGRAGLKQLFQERQTSEVL